MDNSEIVYIRQLLPKNALQIQLPTKVIKDYKMDRVVFNYRELTIRQATICDLKSNKVNRNSFSTAFNVELIGEYEIERLDDYIALYKKN
jgi:hypothetical protein